MTVILIVFESFGFSVTKTWKLVRVVLVFGAIRIERFFNYKKKKWFGCSKIQLLESNQSKKYSNSAFFESFLT